MGFASRQSQEDWEEAYSAGYDAGLRAARRDIGRDFGSSDGRADPSRKKAKKKRKPSAWNLYVKANSKKPRFIYQGGAKKGKLKLKKMAIAFRKTPAGRKGRK